MTDRENARSLSFLETKRWITDMHNQIDLYKKNIFDNLKKFSRIKHKEQHQLLSKKTKPHWFKE